MIKQPLFARVAEYPTFCSIRPAFTTRLNHKRTRSQLTQNTEQSTCNTLPERMLISSLFSDTPSSFLYKASFTQTQVCSTFRLTPLGNYRAPIYIVFKLNVRLKVSYFAEDLYFRPLIMKGDLLAILFCFLAHSLLATASPMIVKRADPIGIDVSDFTTGVDFNTVKANGVSFVYIKATEGTSTFQSIHLLNVLKCLVIRLHQ